jgi:hypothetical protein
VKQQRPAAPAGTAVTISQNRLPPAA